MDAAHVITQLLTLNRPVGTNLQPDRESSEHVLAWIFLDHDFHGYYFPALHFLSLVPTR